MEQIEVTIRVQESLENAIKKLEEKGFKLIRRSQINDLYMSQLVDKLNSSNIQNILSKSVLLRYLNQDGKEIKKITYKNKKYDNNNDLLSEQKVSIDCEDLETAKKLFECLEFKELIRVKYQIFVMKRNNMEFAFQLVENLGLLLEYENSNDYTGKTDIEIKEAKENMFKEIQELGIKTTDEMDVRKAKELICKKYKKELNVC